MNDKKRVIVKNERLAAVASFLFPGLGHIYVGQIGQGIGIFIVSVLLFLLVIITIHVSGLFLLFYVGVWIWSITDAYSEAKRYNSELQKTGKPPW